MQDNTERNAAIGNEEEVKEIRPTMSEHELVGKLNQRYGRTDLGENQNTLAGIHFYRNSSMILPLATFYAIFNPSFGYNVSTELLSAVRGGVPFSVFHEAIRKNDLALDEVVKLRQAYKMTGEHQEMQDAMEKAVDEERERASKEFEEERIKLTETHEKELSQAKEMYQSEIEKMEQEIIENRELNVAFIRAEMEAIRQMEESHKEGWTKAMEVIANSNANTDDKYKEEFEEKKLAFAKEKSELKEESKKRQEELKEEIKEKKEEIRSLEEKIHGMVDEIAELKGENARLSAMCEVYKEKHREEEKTPVQRVFEEPAAPEIKEEKKGILVGRKKKVRRDEKDELIDIFSMKEVDDDQAQALAEAYENGASLEHIRKAAEANVSVERIRIMFDVATIPERNG